MIFFWLAYKESRLIYWLIFGIFLGLGFEAKYQIIFLVFAIIAFLLIFSRVTFIKIRFWIGVCTSLLIFLPNIIWNANHSWITFVFQGIYGLQRSFGTTNPSLARILAKPLVFMRELLTFPDLVLILAVILSLFVTIHLILNKKKEEALFLFFSFSFITLFFSLFFGKSHWFFPGAIGAIILLSSIFSELIKNKFSAIFACLIVLLLLTKSILLSYEFINVFAYSITIPKRFAKSSIHSIAFYGSRDWRGTITKLSKDLDYKNKRQQLFTEDYTAAGELAFYLPNHPEIYSPNGQYLIWGKPKNLASNKIVVSSNYNFVSTYNTANQTFNTIRNQIRILYYTQLSEADLRSPRFNWNLKIEGP